MNASSASASGRTTTISRRPARFRSACWAWAFWAWTRRRSSRRSDSGSPGGARRRNPRPASNRFCGPEGLKRLLPQTDVLVALLPLTPETRGILNAALFAELKQRGPLGGPVLINAGRGGLQVEADILAALDSGVLKAASLDVFEQEPLSASSPLWTHPSVYVSPHNAAISAPAAIAAAIARQIEAFERGEPLSNVVDREKGY